MNRLSQGAIRVIGVSVLLAAGTAAYALKNGIFGYSFSNGHLERTVMHCDSDEQKLDILANCKAAFAYSDMTGGSPRGEARISAMCRCFINNFSIRADEHGRCPAPSFQDIYERFRHTAVALQCGD